MDVILNKAPRSRLGISILITLVGVWSSVSQAVEITNIEALIGQAVASHPLVGTARAELYATNQELDAAELSVFPAPTVQSGYDGNNGLTTSIAVRQPLWTGGKLSSSIRQAYYDDQSALANVSDQRNQVAKNTVAAWQSYVEATGLQQI